MFCKRGWSNGSVNDTTFNNGLRSNKTNTTDHDEKMRKRNEGCLYLAPPVHIKSLLDDEN